MQLHVKLNDSLKTLLKYVSLPWFSHHILHCLSKLLSSRSFVIHSHTQSKVLYLPGVKKLISKERNSHHRHPMVSWLVETAVSHMRNKSFDIFVSQQITLASVKSKNLTNISPSSEWRIYVSLENLVLDQLIIPILMFSFFLITYLIDIVLIL